MERKYDPAREGGFSSSEDESTSESDGDEDEEEAEIEEEAESAQGTDVPMGGVSARLAAVNLDWDNIRAVDLMAVASSFAPADGRILKVTVYPSEFGRERLEREELEGPPKEIFAAHKTTGFDDEGTPEPSDSDSDAVDEEIKRDLLKENKGEEFDPTALRTYQLDRLRYYYAILACSSASVAKTLYDAMDGREYLSSANFFDLRFVPDDVTFDEKPRDECTAIPDAYRPNEFVTDALTHSKVKLTWDADDNTRKEVQKRAFSRKEIDENDLMAYIGSDSSSSEEPDDGPERSVLKHGNNSSKKEKASKAVALRAALGLSADQPSKPKKREPGAPVGDMQVTFSAGLSAAAPRGSVFGNEPITDETTVEKYVRKEKERKARRKEKAKAARNAGDPDAGAADAKTGAGANEKGDEGEEKDPFDDPFFDDPATVSRGLAKAARRAKKAKKREERTKEEAASAAQRAELELLMVDDDAAGGAGMRHFDMNEVAKVEKAKKQKEKKKRGKGAGEEEVEEKTDGFKMDVQDPRFARLFESHEFAIDPTNPKFKGTEGMKALLEEGRRKRKAGRDDGDEEGMRTKSKKMKDNPEEGTAGDDLNKLVERVKGKTKARS